jgi:hypothetical protein
MSADGLSALSNPLATPAQLAASGSRLDGVPTDLERSALFLGARLTQMAGVLLRQPPDAVARAVVLFTRFWVGPEGGSMRDYSVKVRSIRSGRC